VIDQGPIDRAAGEEQAETWREGEGGRHAVIVVDDAIAPALSSRRSSGLPHRGLYDVPHQARKAAGRGVARAEQGGMCLNEVRPRMATSVEASRTSNIQDVLRGQGVDLAPHRSVIHNRVLLGVFARKLTKILAFYSADKEKQQLSSVSRHSPADA
jgi:hypothetical protein